MAQARYSNWQQFALLVWWASTAIIWLHVLLFYAFVARVWITIGHDPAPIPDSPIHASSYYPEMQVAVLLTWLPFLIAAPAQLLVLFTKATADKPWRLAATLSNGLVLFLYLFGRHIFWFTD